MPRTLGVFFIIMESEIWKDVVGYEGLYQVSNFGSVKSLRINGKKKGIMSQGNHNGYPCIFLRKDGKRHWYAVHRLVALAFIPQIDGKDCVDHIDGNTTNNHVSNLRWCTNQENTTFPLAMQHRRKAALGENNPFYGKKHSQDSKDKISKSRMGKYGGDKNPFFGKKHSEETKRILSEKKKARGGIPVNQYSKDGSYIKTWPHAKIAGETLNISPSSIRGCCKGLRKSIGGFLWKYANNNNNGLFI